ncbi:hypothetical protein PsorP6_002587 [Peronosclerospora sorghi]|uniref:Uncharacterized protein n=1 Tax=Peronosclerospora sorghi TaxID=230839 RepID=A0ACC0WRL2_9STRA|nr:hypothetical protein PsorP6_002587 [Peronosclerospora sorghi]
MVSSMGFKLSFRCDTTVICAHVLNKGQKTAQFSTLHKLFEILCTRVYGDEDAETAMLCEVEGQFVYKP